MRCAVRAGLAILRDEEIDVSRDHADIVKLVRVELRERLARCARIVPSDKRGVKASQRLQEATSGGGGASGRFVSNAAMVSS